VVRVSFGINILIIWEFLAIIHQKSYSKPVNESIKLNFTENHPGSVTVTPEIFTIAANASGKFNISVLGISPGHVDITGIATPPNLVNDFGLFFRIIVANSQLIIYVSLIVGWIYFVAWSVSFYPQLVINYNRKSVVGLSFDFLALNFVGHTLYAIFNSCLYFVPFFQEEYFSRFPRGTNPVELNDVFFSIHASVITAVTIVQCFMYEVMRWVELVEKLKQIAVNLSRLSRFEGNLSRFWVDLSRNWQINFLSQNTQNLQIHWRMVLWYYPKLSSTQATHFLQPKTKFSQK